MVEAELTGFVNPFNADTVCFDYRNVVHLAGQQRLVPATDILLLHNRSPECINLPYNGAGGEPGGCYFVLR